MQRAQVHLDSIIKLAATLKNGKCEIVPEENLDMQTGFLRVHLSPKPPLEISIIAGDCLFNLRSALDYIVWQLVAVNNGTPGDKHMFPIARNASAFDFAVNKGGRMDDVPVKALALAEKLQPYHGGEDHPLALLSKLHNIDKHNRLNLTTTVAHDVGLSWNAEAESASLLELWLGNDELSDGAIMPVGMDFNAMPSMRERFMKMNVNGYASLSIAFSEVQVLTPEMVAFDKSHFFETSLDSLRVDETLQEIIEYIGNTVVPTFEPFFS